MLRLGVLLFVMVASLMACAHVQLGAPTPEVTPDNPNLLSNGNPTDPNRQVTPGTRPCVVACPQGYRCAATGQCELESGTLDVRDAGPAWLP